MPYETKALTYLKQIKTSFYATGNNVHIQELRKLLYIGSG